jgi:hypothetical protein
MKRLAFLAAVACLSVSVLAGTGRADFIYTFTTTMAGTAGGGSLSVTIDVSDAQVATGEFDSLNITSLSLSLSGTSSPFNDLTDNSVTDLIDHVFVDPTTGAFIGLTPPIDFFDPMTTERVDAIASPGPPTPFDVVVGTTSDSG